MKKNKSIVRVSCSDTFNKAGPIGSSLCEKMPLNIDAKVPYIQIMENNASMATVKKIFSPCCYSNVDFILKSA